MFIDLKKVHSNMTDIVEMLQKSVSSNVFSKACLDVNDFMPGKLTELGLGWNWKRTCVKTRPFICKKGIVKMFNYNMF